MHINENKLNSIYMITGSKKIRIFLQMFSENSSISFAEIQNQWNSYSSSAIAYYLRKLRINNIIIYDLTTQSYYLSRIGIQVTRMMNNFESLCRNYDIADLDKEGKIEMKVVGRKL